MILQNVRLIFVQLSWFAGDLLFSVPGLFADLSAQTIKVLLTLHSQIVTIKLSILDTLCRDLRSSAYTFLD